MTALSADQASELRAILEKRDDELRAAIAAERADAGELRAGLAESAHDRGDEALADVMAETQSTLASRHYEEWREVLAALQRLDRGEFGACADCAEPIAYARLRAAPTALRCVACQDRHDRGHAHAPTPAL